MDWTAAYYLGYLAIAIPLTVWVARTLSHNGRLFLEGVFAGERGLAEAVNTLLMVGFYLLILGTLLLYLPVTEPVTGLTGLLESLSTKIGVVMILLGLLHLGNVFVFNAIRRRRVAHGSGETPAFAAR
ncbi:MAG: hypothetical protein ACRCYQ_14165 [Nocardioides sp.]